jgi:hypothetical protein
METATQPQAKRTRFDGSVSSPDDMIATPMAAARSTLQAHCASLQPEIGTLLSTLGKEHLLLIQKELHKSAQATKMTVDTTLIPRSARVKFELTTSKLTEADEGYIRLKEETQCIVDNFQNALKSKILELTHLEARLLRKTIVANLATNLFVTTKALLIADHLTTIDPHRIVNTILEQYSTPLLDLFDITAEDFRTLYRHSHALTLLPPVIPATLAPIGTIGEAAISSPVFQSVIKIYRVIDNIFLAPWTSYKDTQKRIDVTAALKALRVEHLEPAATDAAAMMIDNEPAAEPPQLRAVIDKQVDQRTKVLQKELSVLRAQVAKLSAAVKPTMRGPSPGASLKKKTQGKVVGPGNVTPNASGNPTKNRSSTTRSKRRSSSKGPSRSTRPNASSTLSVRR